MLRSLISCFLLQAAIGSAKEAYYLDVHSQGAVASVTLNGYQLWEVVNPEGQAFSSFVSPYLRSGKNELKIDFRIPKDEERELINPWVDCQIIKAPADHKRTPEAPGETVVKKRYDPEERRKLSSLAPDEYTILSGSTPKGGGLYYFNKQSERRWSFGIQLTENAKSFFQKPRSVELTGITDSLVFGEFHLLNSKSGARVAYNKLKFLRGGEQVAISPEHLAKGVAATEEQGFDTLWIFGLAAEGVTDVRVLDLELFYTPKPVSETVHFEIQLESDWATDQAEKLGDLALERESLTAFLKSLHRTMDKESVEKWLPFFEVKLEDLSKALGQPRAQLAESQKEYFANLKAIKSWSLEPFDARRLIFKKINSRVVAVSYVDSEGPIISIPLVRPGRDKLDRFKIPLYLAKVKGAWTVVR